MSSDPAKPAPETKPAPKPTTTPPSKPAPPKSEEKPVELPAFEKSISDKITEKFGDLIEVAFVKKIELE